MTSLLIHIFIRQPADLKDPSVRTRCGYLGSWAGITLNLLLFIGKFLAGLLSGAISVTADAFNNLSDAGSSVMSLVGFRIAAQPADKEHPYGHGRMEYVSGLVISFVIMLMGFELAQTSAEKIFRPKDIRFSYLTLGILIASVLVKLWMALFYRKLGKMIDSTSLRAASADSLSDCASTAAVIAAMLILKLTGMNIDGYIGAAVAVFIIISGIRTFKESLTPILGARPDKELMGRIKQSVMSFDGILGVHDILMHDYGVGNLMVSLHAEIPAQMSLTDAHRLIDSIEEKISADHGCTVTIHMDPVESEDPETARLLDIIRDCLKKQDEALSLHDFRVVDHTDRTELVFDVVVPFGTKITRQELSQSLDKAVKEIDRRYVCKITIDTDYEQ
ncbi:cation diffusion facilitator family transporter [Ruminococcus sp. FC2018]|uniref:cation diffusion facilitator family transporter n=1 Tax=Ruminococcus sp. FC2018 TaxID=1410617 RepID=UPI00048BA57F|nr:cation diffusion facilitator family transporter [Ruminococcus sp. FC2018]